MLVKYKHILYISSVVCYDSYVINISNRNTKASNKEHLHLQHLSKKTMNKLSTLRDILLFL